MADSDEDSNEHSAPIKRGGGGGGGFLLAGRLFASHQGCCSMWLARILYPYSGNVFFLASIRSL